MIAALYRWWLRARIRWAWSDLAHIDRTHPLRDQYERGTIFATAEWSRKLRSME